MIVGVIGSGGREHAICEQLKRSKKVNKIYCFPGNAGTFKIADNVNIDINNFEIFKDYILKNKIGLVVVGPEKPLVDGLVDYLQKFKIKVFGPNKLASQLEGSKIFTKKICEKYNIPSAKFGVFHNIDDANNFLKSSSHPIVIKADNLASGKGVYICDNFEESSKAVKEVFEGKFGKTNKVLIEEFLKGEEMSFFIISDGISIQNFGTAQDHKRVLEGDKGKNTGGMGAYSPSRLINDELEKKILNKIINPTIKGLSDLGSVYKGFLYAGLMIINNEPYLIEYNVRMGDPETEVVIPRIKSDLLNLLKGIKDGTFSEKDLNVNDEVAATVMLTSSGYPEKYSTGYEISGVEDVDCSIVFHAGTKFENDKLITCGGRVMSITSFGKTKEVALKNSYESVSKINFKGKYYRTDIGFDL